MMSARRWLRVLSGFLLVPGYGLGQARTQRVPFVADRWTAVKQAVGDSATDVQFVKKEGFPDGVLVLKGGEVALNGLAFRNGTIEFDLKPTAVDIPGISFRRTAQGDGEEFYIRSFPDCRAENDCIQYAPVIHGFLLWNGYPQYQTSAPVMDGWNHVKLVVSGRRMNVYLNHSSVPSLVVGSLQSDAREGGVQLRGPAFFANLTVSPEATEGLSAAAVPDPAVRDERIVRQWSLGPLTALHYGRNPVYGEMPAANAGWKLVRADDSGLVNLNRQFQANEDATAMTWLQSTVVSATSQQKVVAMGWIGHAWIFVNGKLVTQGKNFYYPDEERRDPDGRLSFVNGSFAIPLEKGKNEIVVALFDSVRDQDGPRTKYTWGMEMRFADVKGLAFVGR